MQNAIPASGEMTPAQFERTFDVKIDVDPEALTAVFAFNEGDGRLPFTPWMIAHRLAHLIDEQKSSLRDRTAISEALRSLNSVWRDLGYENVGMTSLDHLIHEIGTFKSARDGTTGDLGEFVAECFAQYLITGKITLKELGDVVHNRASPRTRSRYPKLADMLDADVAAGKDAQTIPNATAANAALSRWATATEEMFRQELNQARGKIIVM